MVARNRGHAELGLHFFEYGLEDADPGGNLTARATALITAMSAPDRQGADDMTLDFTASLLSPFDEWMIERDEAVQNLLQALATEGFELVGGRLVTTTPQPLVARAQVSTLEQDLTDAEMTVSLRHYQQAVDSFTNANFEAANGQLRSFFEAFVARLAETLTGRPSTNFNAALQRLRDGGHIDDAEFHGMRSFWAEIQDNGPHAGLSDGEEALFRLQVGSARARYFLRKLL